ENSISIHDLNKLNERHESWVKSYDKGKLLIIDVDPINFVDNPEDLGGIINRMDAEVNGLFSVTSLCVVNRIRFIKIIFCLFVIAVNEKSNSEMQHSSLYFVPIAIGTFRMAMTYLLLFFFICPAAIGQENWNVSLQTYQGAILPHSKNISHLITNKPTGYLFSVNHRVNGSKEWHHTYRFPEIGFSFHIQNNHNETLGDLYGL